MRSFQCGLIREVTHIDNCRSNAMTLDQYLARRLGPGTPSRMALNLLVRPFTATSLPAFWRYWNPGYGFFLLYYCYRPLRKLFSHSVSVFLTFLVCGGLHDLLYVIPMWLRDGSMPMPFVACWFATIATCILVTAPFGLRFHSIRPLARVPLHVGFLVATFSFTIYVGRVT